MRPVKSVPMIYTYLTLNPYALAAQPDQLKNRLILYFTRGKHQSCHPPNYPTAGKYT